MDSTGSRSLSNRDGRGRRRGRVSVQSEWQICWQGGRGGEPPRGLAASWGAYGNLVEREKGDVWNRNFCVLIDYRLWAAKSEGRPWVAHCLNLYVAHCLA